MTMLQAPWTIITLPPCMLTPSQHVHAQQLSSLPPDDLCLSRSETRGGPRTRDCTGGKPAARTSITLMPLDVAATPCSCQRFSLTLNMPRLQLCKCQAVCLWSATHAQKEHQQFPTLYLV